MIPYIIINGVSSKSVNGLLIQNLPPISKPKIRTELEEIDGRDGDVVTILGYAAYDKSFNIGLRGDYNIDDVIKFFDASGQIIFSNEVDKYYNFATYEQIDFERLIRYRTATVKMHVQPFKYSAEEKEATYSYPSGTTSATIKARNNGNIYSKPKITITGAGTIYVYLNGTQVFTISLASAGETIIIDVNNMNAYDQDGNYLNRQVIGGYDNFILAAGSNAITINGAITNVSLDNVSRWI